jgi:outer membrane receptor protein involved in Fe transport
VVVDAALGYRLPKRWGILTLGARNLLDEKFLYQDDNFRTSDIRYPFFIPDRVIFARITLSF